MTHVFLSYQHQFQETVLKPRDALKSHGFKTWVDEDDMVGSTLESMAEAVEKADVVIMCMSASYKASKNCQKEIEYAERKNKPIIPICVEAGFKSSGWLGLSSGSKMVIDFSDPKKFDEKFKRLLKELAAKNIKIEYAERKNKPIIPICVEAGFKSSGWLGLSSGSKMVIDFSDPKKFDEKFKRLLKELAAKNIKPTEVDIEKYRDECCEDDEDEDDVDDEEEDEDGDEDDKDGD